LESVFEKYSRSGLTESTDRSTAISGLEKRFARAFESDGDYGILQCYLHRCLLWQRSGDEKMKRISYPTNRTPPSWSWMAYEGEISYMDIPFYQVEWSNAVHCRLELKAVARKFSLNEMESRLLKFDEDDQRDIGRLRCIVIGRKRSESDPRDEQEHYILVVEPLEWKKNTYKRVGVGSILRRHISFEGPAIEVRIV
jgi:hypothetical protein